MIVNYVDLRMACLVSGVLCLFFSPCGGALPPDPNNAALLYYQAFLLMPAPNPVTKELVERVANGAEPNEQTRGYVERCRIAVEYAQKAAGVPHCDWGLWYSLGHHYSLPHLESARFLSRILQVNARVLAADGDFRGAIGRCLMIRGLAKHVGIETYASYATAMEIEKRAESTICHILGSKSPDTEAIAWLKSQLAAVPPVSRSVTRAVQMDLEMALQHMQEGGGMQLVRHQIAAAKDGENAKDLLDLSDRELLSRIRKPYVEFLDSALRVIDSNLPYGETCVELQNLVSGIQKKGGNAVVRALGVVLGNAVVGSYTLQVRNAARRNAFSIALDLYVEKARTGRLPDRLPDGLPKDPESGEDFIYTPAEDEFTLLSRFEPPEGRERLQLTYKVR